MLPQAVTCRPAGPQDRFEHSGGGRLAVGAGDHQPVPRGAARLVDPPGQLDLADHLDPGGGAAASSGLVGGIPAEVTTRVVPAGGVCRSPAKVTSPGSRPAPAAPAGSS